MHRRHAGGGDAAGFRPFEFRQALFQHGDRRVAEAGILVVRHGAGKGSLGLLGAFIDKAGGEEDGLGGLAMLAAHSAAMHQAGGGTEIIG